MKNLWISVLFIVNLAACAGVSSDNKSCSMDEKLCIEMEVAEPVLFNETNTITITVSSTENISNLKIYLYPSPGVQIEDIDSWVNHGINWVIEIEANQPRSFVKNFLLPESDGVFQIVTSANTPQLGAIYSLRIHQHQGISTVYYAGTPIPITQGDLSTIDPLMLATLQAMPTRTHYPTLTPMPTKTSTPVPQAYPPPASPTVP